MNIRRCTKNIIAALLAMVLCLTGFLPLSGMQTVRAEEKEAKIWFKDSEDNADSGKATFVSDKGGIVYASVEKFTVGQGYLIEPTEVSFEAGDLCRYHRKTSESKRLYLRCTEHRNGILSGRDRPCRQRCTEYSAVYFKYVRRCTDQ